MIFKQLKKHTKSLQMRMIIVYSTLIILFLLIISLIFSLAFSSRIDKTTKDYTNQIISQVNSNIEYYFEEMEQIATIANYDYEIQKRLKADLLSNTELYRSNLTVSNLLDDMSIMREDIEAILIFTNDGSIIVNKSAGKLNKNYNFKPQSWYKQAVQTSGSSVTIKPHKQSYISDSNNLVFSLSRSINNFDSEEQIGIILIDLNIEALNSICSSVQLGEEGYIMIIDEESNVIYHPDYSYMYRTWDEMYIKEVFKADDILIQDALESDFGSFKRKLENETKYVIYQKMASTGWTILGIVPQSVIVQQQRQITLLIVIIGILCVLIAILVTFVLSSRVFKPINQLKKTMALAEHGNLNVSVEESHYTEIDALNTSFNQMIMRIQTLMEKVVWEEREKRKAELKVLQAQINPHFLYNTLDSIHWMAECNSKEAVVMVDSLAKLFRLSLSKGRQFITVKEEIEHVRNYLTIQSMRYKGKFDYKIDVEESLLNYKTLKLILQPLVENAIYHGIKNKRKKGNLLIRCTMCLNNILFQVMDDGIGMDEDMLENIFNQNESNQLSGVGINNVNERIKLCYGQEYGLDFYSKKSIGTVVDIWLPAVPYNEENN